MKIVSMVEGEENGWFWEKMTQRLGDGRDALFWEGAWAGNSSLKALFPRLFLLSTNKKGTVKEMGRWVSGEWVWGLEWRRNLFDWEREKEHELLEFLRNVSVVEGAADRWWWGGDKDGIYSVKDAYTELAKLHSRQSSQRPDAASCGYIWKSSAVLKAKLTAWRLLRNCLPTKDNVSKRVDLEAEAMGCVVCGKARESARHLFLECERGAAIWSHVLRWIGVSWVAPNRVEGHLSSFAGMFPGKKWRRRMGGLWICVIWVLWRWRNEMFFVSKEWDLGRILEEIKCRFHSWCAIGNEVETLLNYHSWANANLVTVWSNDL